MNRTRTVFRSSALAIGLVALLLGAMPGVAGAQQDPVSLYLTWRTDPSTTMVVDWHTLPGRAAAQVEFRPSGSGSWTHVAPDTIFPFPHSDRTVHRLELTGLVQDSEYEFRFAADGPVRRFRTMPAEMTRPIRFAAGGDMRHNREWMAQTARVAARFDLDFVIIGGDLAYADGRADRVDRWHEWFEVYTQDLTRADGRVIPMLVAPGNHEVLRGGFANHDDFDHSPAAQARIAPYFFSLFATPGHPGYGVIDFGRYLSVLLLDTDHTAPITGAQTEWLATTLRERQHVAHLVPVYHVPAYPSVRSPDGPRETRVRENWVPLFERYGVRVAFEKHDHAYKRTHPLLGGRIDPRGVVYIGDGAWGTDPRPIGRDHGEGGPAWYLDHAVSVRHLIVGTLHGAHQHFVALDHAGAVIDEYPSTPGFR
jgi:acid phosphatase type 7